MSSEIEKVVAAVAGESLSRRIGAEDLRKPYRELGGTSLGAVQVCAQVKDSTGVLLDVSIFLTRSMQEACTEAQAAQ